MEVLQNFKSLFFDVWKKGISGVNISEIIIALLTRCIFPGTYSGNSYCILDQFNVNWEKLTYNFHASWR